MAIRLSGTAGTLAGGIALALSGFVVSAAPTDAADNKVAATTAAAGTIDSVTVIGDRPRDSLALDSVATTGSRLSLEARDLPASVSIVSHELIDLRGARTAIEAVEAAVGMTGGTSVGSIPNYATRGFAGNDITVMRDGIRQNTASQSSRPLDSFLFERIEVLKGPASLLYGEGAIGGAVNYVSKVPDKTFRGESAASIGAWDSYRAALGLGGPTGVDNVYFRADASYNTTGGHVDRSDADYQAAAASVLWDVTEKTHATVSGTFLKDDVSSYYGTPVVYDAVIDLDGIRRTQKANSATDRLVNARIDSRTRRLNYDNIDNFARTENAFWRAVVDTQLSSGWSLRNESYVATQKLQWRNTESTLWNPQTQLVDRGSFLLIYRDDFQWGNRADLKWSTSFAGRPNEMVIGALYDDNDQARNSGQSNYVATPTPVSVPLVGFNPGYGPAAKSQKTVSVNTRNTAVYVEDVFTPWEQLKLIAGLRYEKIDVERVSYVGAPTFNIDYEPFTGRVGAIYSVTPELNVYASYSRAAQPVSQLVSIVSTQADFSLQKGQQTEVGLKGTFWDRRADLTVAVYDIEKNDLLTQTLIDNVIVNSQIGAQVSQGAEVALTVSPVQNWRIDANLAWTWKAEFEDFNENISSRFVSRDGNTPPNIPEWVGGVFIVTDRGPWSATAGVRYVGERQANNNNGIQMDAYLTVDASISRQWGPLQATLRGRNLTDEAYEEWASGGGLMQRLADPRSAEFSVKYSF
jgi:iron complex outermembrane receptor protein